MESLGQAQNNIVDVKSYQLEADSNIRKSCFPGFLWFYSTDIPPEF